MKQLNFRLVIVIVLLALTVNLNAQERTKRGFIPDEIAVQYAGNIGIVSVGAGWNYAKKDCLGTTFAIGYVPDYHSYHGSACFSLKEEYTPWRVKMGEVAAFRPLTVGIMVTLITGNNFWILEPHHYPSNYYGVMSKIRFHLLLSQQFDFFIKNKKNDSKRRLSFFYQVNSYDLNIIDSFNSEYVKFKDILDLAIGIKIQI